VGITQALVTLSALEPRRRSVDQSRRKGDAQDYPLKLGISRVVTLIEIQFARTHSRAYTSAAVQYLRWLTRHGMLGSGKLN
jgi:hypothetical protein